MFRRFRSAGSDDADSSDVDENNQPPAPNRVGNSGLAFRSHSTPDATITSRQALTVSPRSSIGKIPAASDTTLVEPTSRISRRTTFFRDRSPVPEDPLGLILIHGTADCDADIIFVHGLGGSSRKTWSWNRDPEIFWPSWIYHEQGLSSFRVFTFGYNANFRDSDTPLSILDFSKGLLVRMRAYGQGANDSLAFGMKPIVFVAHSMGGLVVKKALMIGKSHDQYSTMLSKVHGIMFLSTPHKGSSHASTLNSFLSVLVGSSTKVYISELDPSSTSIEDISEQFRGICGSWELVSLYETKATRLSPGIKRMIVDKESGVLNYPKETTVPVDADHHSICKFQSRLDPNYRLVVDLLRQITSGIIPSQPVTTLVKRTSSLKSPTTRKAKDFLNYTSVLEKMLGIKGTPQADLDSHLARSLPGSCQWLHRNRSFQSWLDASDGAVGVLWLSALPGTGKSTLAAKTIEHIQRALNKPSCQHHFFMETQPVKQTVAYCLRTIAFQLASTHHGFAEKLFHLHNDTGFIATEQKFSVIWDTIFENIVFKMDFGHTLHWVLDGVDEAEAPKLLVRNLVQINPRTCIKILLLSRPKKDLTSLVTTKFGPTSLIQVSIHDTQDDIEDYIASITSEIFPNDEDPIHEYVIQQIRNKAEGSFLWARLALDTLRDNWHTQADIDLALNSVPTGMHSLYQRMMANVRSQSPRLQDIAFRVLTWASCAFRPLTITELAAALQPEFDGFVSLSETVVQICGQFVRVNDDRLSLIHSTARHYLLNFMPANSSGIPSTTIGKEAGHDRLAIACLQYLSQDHWRQKLSLLSEAQERVGTGGTTPSTDRLKPLYEAFPLLRYAINHWAYHISQASTDNPSLFSFLRLFCNKYILQWIQAISLSNRLERLPSAARNLKMWIRKGRRRAQLGGISPTSMGMTVTEATFLEEWIVDLIRLVGKFGSNLVQSPSSVHKNIPPLCPSGSIISRTYCSSQPGDNAGQLVSVKGLSIEDWDDNLARLSVGEDELASIIRCAGNYFLALIPHNGTVIIWHKETCEEVRRLQHGEWTTLIAVDKTGRLAATAGRFTFRVWELTTGRLLYKLPKISLSRTMSLDFAVKGDMQLLVCYDDCTVSCYDLESAQEVTRFAEPGQGGSLQRSCPRFMSLSPDQTKVAIAFRGRPVAVWDIPARRPLHDQDHLLRSSIPTRVARLHVAPRFCIRNSDKDLELDGDDVFNSPEVVRWQPLDGSMVYILYQDTTILVWDLVEDTQVELGDTQAREMVLNSDGTLLLTSSNGGSVRVWALPRFNLVYELNSDDFVRDLTFSPDSQRIYDVRGSGCNVWAPDILIRPDGLDPEETSSSADGSYLSEIVSEPVLAKDQESQRGHVTALVCDNNDEFFCVGRDDGAVNIHSMEDGRVVRKAYKHSATVDITVIEWSISHRFIASADDSGKVIAKRLRIKEDDKWAVFPLFDLRVSDTITQLLFSQDESLLLISTESSDRLWDLKAKKELCKRQWGPASGRRWLHHPDNPAQLIWLSPSQLRVHTWTGLPHESDGTGVMEEHQDEARASQEGEEEEDEEEEQAIDNLGVPLYPTTSRTSIVRGPPLSPRLSPNTVLQEDQERPEIIKSILQPSNRQFILYESLPGSNNIPQVKRQKEVPSHSSTRNKNPLHLIQLPMSPSVSTTPTSTTQLRRRPLPTDLNDRIRSLLGCVRDKIVFIDYENWVCTSSAITNLSIASTGTDAAGASSPVKRHFFLPRDWVNSMTLQLVTSRGKLLSARNGEVAVLRYGKGF